MVKRQFVRHRNMAWSLLNRFARNRDTAVPAEGNGDLQTLICVLVARPRRCFMLSNPVPTKLNGGLSWLHSVDEDAVSWMTNYGPWHAYKKERIIVSSTWLVSVSHHPVWCLSCRCHILSLFVSLCTHLHVTLLTHIWWTLVNSHDCYHTAQLLWSVLGH